MKVTLQMIADRVGVTCATVSLALRDAPQISEARRKEIRETAEALGYRPNALVSTLMAKIRQGKAPPRRTGLLYLYTGGRSFPGDPGATPELFFRGAKEQAAKRGFNLEPFWLREPGLGEKRIDRILAARGIPGVIVGPREDLFPLPALPWERLAVVMISHSFEEPAFDRVAANFHSATRLAMDKIGRGRRGAPVRLILPERHDRNVRHLWTASYLHARLARPHVLAPLVVEAAGPAVAWVRANRGCTILGTNRVLEWLEDAGLARGRDFEFVSLNVEGRPELSGIREPGLEVGAEAADLVIGRIYLNRTGIPDKPRETLIEPDWQDGVGAG